MQSRPMRLSLIHISKPGIIMEAFSMSGESNLVFIINELDKANAGKGNGNPADVLLTLLDNLGFTDNYMECMVPTVGVYPIATANDKSQISAPLMSRFAVIDICLLYTSCWKIMCWRWVFAARSDGKNVLFVVIKDSRRKNWSRLTVTGQEWQRTYFPL